MHARAILRVVVAPVATVALIGLAGLGGCASTVTTQSIKADRALCQQATDQARRGDLRWSATLDRMQNLIELQNCRDDINEFVFGSVNGGRD